MTTRNYKSQPKFINDRVEYAVTQKQEKIMAKWEFSSGLGEGTCANLSMGIIFKRGKASVRSKNSEAITNVHIYEAISSAFLLYKLICLAGCSSQAVKVETYADAYKSVWFVSLKHKASGKVLGFGDSKAGAQFWTEFGGVEGIPPAFLKDLLELLTLIAGDVVHTYDGTIAGSVA